MRSVSAGGPAEMAGELEYSLFEHVSWNLKGYFQFHAALAAKDGCGVLIPGRTRSGKTTLALSLWRLGWNVFTDDMSFLEPKSGLFLPFPRPFNLREETLTLLKPETAGCEIPVGPPDFDAPSAYFHPCWLPGRNGLLPKPTGVRWIIFPTRRERARKKPDLRPLRPSQAIRRLVPSAYILKETRVRGLEIVSGLIDATEHYELVMGAPEETASLMDEQLGLAGVKDEGVSPGRGRA
jgi:hypothetical protein